MSSGLARGQGTKRKPGGHVRGCSEAASCGPGFIAASLCGSVLGRWLGPLALLAPWAQSPRCAEGMPDPVGRRPRAASLCPSLGARRDPSGRARAPPAASGSPRPGAPRSCGGRSCCPPTAGTPSGCATAGGGRPQRHRRGSVRAGPGLGAGQREGDWSFCPEAIKEMLPTHPRVLCG